MPDAYVKDPKLVKLRSQRSTMLKNIVNIKNRWEGYDDKTKVSAFECNNQILNSYFHQICQVQTQNGRMG